MILATWFVAHMSENLLLKLVEKRCFSERLLDKKKKALIRYAFIWNLICCSHALVMYLKEGRRKYINLSLKINDLSSVFSLWHIIYQERTGEYFFLFFLKKKLAMIFHSSENWQKKIWSVCRISGEIFNYNLMTRLL